MVQTAIKPASSSWSISRDQQLQSCERKYYFHYLAGGRLNGDTPLLKRIGLLKKLKPFPVWVGDVFHRGVVEFFEAHGNNAPLTTERLVALMRARVSRDWRFSAARRFDTNPYQIDKEGVALLEHFYGGMPENNTEQAAIDQVSTLLTRFVAWANETDIVARMRAADRVWIEPDSWGADAPGFVEEGVQVITKVDLAIERHGEKFEIYDWKSGRAPRERPPFLSQHELQVGIYQLWPLLSLGVDRLQISSNLVYFGAETAVVENHTLDDETLPLLRSTLRDSVRLTQQWEARVKAGEIRTDDLTFAANVSTCRQCSFRELCRKQLEAPQNHA